MFITVTVFCQVIEQRLLCYRLKYIRNYFIISILYIISLKVYCLSEANLGVPLYFPPVACLQHISNWQHHLLCSRRSTEHIYIGQTPCMFSAHKDNRNTIQVYLVTAMTHVIALEAGQSSQGALKPITLVQLITNIVIYFQKDTL